MTSPIGWGIGGALLGASLLGLGKKSNKQFEGTIQTGGHQAFKKAGGQMAQIKEGYIPTADEFVQHGRNLLPEDSYAHDYGGTFSEATRKYYDNFRNEAQKYLNQAKAAPKGSRAQKIAMAHYRNTVSGHGFDVAKAAPPKPSGGGKSAPAPEAPKEEPIATPKREDVTKPGSGLEDTVVAPPDMMEKEEIEKPGLEEVPDAPKPEDVLQPDQIDELAERRKRRGLMFTDYKKKRRAGFFSYARPDRVRMA